MNELRFSIPEILSLIGVTQCVYILVYISMRAGRISRAGLPLAYFFVLGAAFFLDFAAATFSDLQYYFYFRWAAWFFGPPLSVLLVIQIAEIFKTPSIRHYWVLLLVPAAFVFAHFAVSGIRECRDFMPCQQMQDWLVLLGFVAGCISLLTIWLNRELLTFINDRKTGKDRYWLILALIFANIFLLSADFLSIGINRLGGTSMEQFVLVRTLLGLTFIYLVGTSLFRIYPRAVLLAGIAGEKREGMLSPAELEIAGKVEALLHQEKVYQEPTYGRSDLARECSVPEAILSKIINIHFKKSFPQIMNELRVEDAKRLLAQTKAPVKIIAGEVGFSSLASFNRAFREIAGETPSAYREKAGI